MKSQQPPATLLLAEDLEDDVFIMRRALKAAGILNPLAVVSDGRELLAYLGGHGPYHDRETFPAPFLLFLDLKMPYHDGFECLEFIGQSPLLKHIPVVVLTSSAQERDQSRAYKLGARTYLVKPPRPADLLSIVSSLESHFIGSYGDSPFLLGQRSTVSEKKG
jgi:CheY-like chemotaxis protein